MGEITLVSLNRSDQMVVIETRNDVLIRLSQFVAGYSSLFLIITLVVSC